MTEERSQRYGRADAAPEPALADEGCGAPRRRAPERRGVLVGASRRREKTARSAVVGELGPGRRRERLGELAAGEHARGIAARVDRGIDVFVPAAGDARGRRALRRAATGAAPPSRRSTTRNGPSTSARTSSADAA